MSGTEKQNIGEILRSRREESGLDIKTLAERTRIRRAYLLALEENRFELLPGEAYLTGFLRVYASALGLRPEELTALYHEQVGAPAGATLEMPKEFQEQALSRRSKSGSKPLIWLAVALLILAALALVSLIRPQPPPVARPDPPAKKLAAPTVPDASVPAAVPPDNQAGLSLPAAASGPAAGAAPAIDDRPEVGKNPEPAASFAQETAAAESSPSLPPDSSAPPITVPGGGQIRLETSGPNRITVRSDNRPVQAYDLTAAAVLSWKIKSSAHIRIEQPAGVKMWLDDRPFDLGSRSEFFLQAAETNGGR